MLVLPSFLTCSDGSAVLLLLNQMYFTVKLFQHSKFEKPKIKKKTKTETKRVRTPVLGRFAPLTQAPPLSFLVSFSCQFSVFQILISEMIIVSTTIIFRMPSGGFPSNMFQLLKTVITRRQSSIFSTPAIRVTHALSQYDQ